MMYDGTEYQSRGKITHKGTSSSSSRKELYMKPGFWHKLENKFWINQNYSPASIEYLNEFANKTDKESSFGEVTANVKSYKN